MPHTFLFFDLLRAARKAAGHFNRSIKGNKLLREKQTYAGIPQDHFILDVSMRWNSTYLTLEKLLKQQRALYKVARVGETGVEAPLNSGQCTLYLTLNVASSPLKI